MPVTRAQIVAEARKWLDTPFGHQQRLLHKGLDCVGLPMMVGEALGLKDKNGEAIHGRMYIDYPAQPLGRFVHDLCAKHLIDKPVRLLQPGDVVSVMVPSAPCHLAIIGQGRMGLTLIHAYSPTKAVVEQPLDIKWQRRIAGCFYYPGVE